MKKLLFAFAIIFAFGMKAQQMANCSMMCVISMTLDTTNNELDILFFNGDSLAINYPQLTVLDQNGDTVAHQPGPWFFQQGQGVMQHDVPTTLTVLPQPFYGTVYMYDGIQDSACVFQVPMSCPMNIIDPGAQQQFSVFPNPATDVLNISLPSGYSGKIQVSITNVLGEVFSGTMLAHNGKIELDINDLASGMYFITVTVGEERYVQRVIHQ